MDAGQKPLVNQQLESVGQVQVQAQLRTTAEATVSAAATPGPTFDGTIVYTAWILQCHPCPPLQSMIRIRNEIQ
jgi:hypothetical protein